MPKKKRMKIDVCKPKSELLFLFYLKSENAKVLTSAETIINFGKYQNRYYSYSKRRLNNK